MLDAGLVLPGEFKLVSGAESNVYIEFSRAAGYPHILTDLCDELYKNFSPGVTCVAGTGYGGVILATALSICYGLKAAHIRTELKEHGPPIYVEGYEPTMMDLTAVVEDVVTTGGSAREVISILQPITRIEGCHAVIKRGDAEFPCKFDYLFDAKEFLDAMK